MSLFLSSGWLMVGAVSCICRKLMETRRVVAFSGKGSKTVTAYGWNGNNSGTVVGSPGSQVNARPGLAQVFCLGYRFLKK